MPTKKPDLIAAIRSGKVPEVQAALAARAKVNEPRSTLPLQVAAEKGSLRIVELLLAAGADPNRCNEDYEATLVFATTPAIVRALIAAGANPNHRSRLTAKTPLDVAINKKRTQVAAALIKGGADPGLATKRGITPIFGAAARGATAIVELLLKHGANPMHKDKHGNTALHCVGRNFDPESLKTARRLLKTGLDPNSGNDRGITPLMEAARYENLPIVDLLLKAGANVNALGVLNDSALQWALEIDDAPVVKRLLAAGADRDVRVSPKHRDKLVAGKTLREIAKGCKPITRALMGV